MTIRRSPLFGAVLLLIAFAVALCAQTLAPVRVFVTSAGAANGFTDPDTGNRDSVKDIKDSLKGYKTVAIAENKDDADIVLTVMGRKTSDVTAGILGSSARDRAVVVKFAYHDIETEMSASAQGGTLGSGGAWGKAAGKIAKQVDEWIKANRAKIAEDQAGR